jgi:hypothetical protein
MRTQLNRHQLRTFPRRASLLKPTRTKVSLPAHLDKATAVLTCCSRTGLHPSPPPRRRESSPFSPIIRVQLGECHPTASSTTVPTIRQLSRTASHTNVLLPNHALQPARPRHAMRPVMKHPHFGVGLGQSRLKTSATTNQAVKIDQAPPPQGVWMVLASFRCSAHVS